MHLIFYFRYITDLSGDACSDNEQSVDTVIQIIPSFRTGFVYLMHKLLSQIEQLLDKRKTFNRSQRILRGEIVTDEVDDADSELPHYFLVININGVMAFNKSEQAEFIPILGLVYSETFSFFRRKGYSSRNSISVCHWFLSWENQTRS